MLHSWNCKVEDHYNRKGVSFKSSQQIRYQTQSIILTMWLCLNRIFLSVLPLSFEILTPPAQCLSLHVHIVHFWSSQAAWFCRGCPICFFVFPVAMSISSRTPGALLLEVFFPFPRKFFSYFLQNTESPQLYRVPALLFYANLMQV